MRTECAAGRLIGGRGGRVGGWWAFVGGGWVVGVCLRNGSAKTLLGGWGAWLRKMLLNGWVGGWVGGRGVGMECEDRRATDVFDLLRRSLFFLFFFCSFFFTFTLPTILLKLLLFFLFFCTFFFGCLRKPRGNKSITPFRVVDVNMPSCSSGFGRIWLDFTGFFFLFRGFTYFKLVCWNAPSFFLIVTCFTGFYRVLLGYFRIFSFLYLVLLNCNLFYMVLLSNTKFSVVFFRLLPFDLVLALSFLCISWILLGLTWFYRVLLFWSKYDRVFGSIFIRLNRISKKTLCWTKNR